MRLDIILEILLENARETWVVTNMGPRLMQAAAKDRFAGDLEVEDIVSKLKDMDPTKNSQYLQWIAKQYVAGQFKLEDANRIKEVVTNFHKFKPRLQQRDINKMDLHTLEQQIDDILSGSDNVDTRETPYTNIPNVEYLYKGPLGILAIPKTEEASCELGRGTKWCTASENNNMFDAYNKKGSLYIWIDRSGKKYQFWWEKDKQVASGTYEITIDDYEDAEGWSEFNDGGIPMLDANEIADAYRQHSMGNATQLMDAMDRPISNEVLDKLRQIPALNKLFDAKGVNEVKLSPELKILANSYERGVVIPLDEFEALLNTHPLMLMLYVEAMSNKHDIDWEGQGYVDIMYNDRTLVASDKVEIIDMMKGESW